MNRRGSMLMEAAMVLPIIVMIAMAVMQFALIMIAQQLTEYAAYCGARAALTCNRIQAAGFAKEAALRVLAVLPADGKSSGEKYAQYPGWEELEKCPKLDGDRVKVDLSIAELQNGVSRCTVELKFPLMIPIPLMAPFSGGQVEGEEKMVGNLKEIKLTGKAVLPLPYGTTYYPFKGGI